MMQTEAEFWANFERINCRPNDATQRALAKKWLSRRGSFKASAVIENGTHGYHSVPAQPSRHNTQYSDTEVFMLLRDHWKAGDVVGIARLHNVLDNRHQLTQPGTFRWAGVKGLPFTVDRRGSSVATITGLYDVRATALPVKVQAAVPACTGGVLVCRCYDWTDEGQRAKAAVIDGRRTGMSLTYSADLDDTRYDGPNERTLRTIKAASVSEFCDTGEAVQHCTFASITALDYVGANGKYLWEL